MTVFHKIFFSFADECGWLEKMNKEGYELMSAAPLTFRFDKTNNTVNYEYIPLKRGKKSFLALDYKKKDKDLKAIYATSDMALFKKTKSKGLPELMTINEKKLAFERYRSSLSLHGIIYTAVFAMLCLTAMRYMFYMLYAPAAVFLIFSVSCFYNASRTEKYIKLLKQQS